jgi:starch synthase (maltosyl-transferring)
LLTRLNTIRRAHPALQQLRNLTIHQTENENIIAFSRRIPAGKMPLAADPEWPTTTPPGTDDVILVVVNLDPWGTQETYLHLDMAALGLVQPDGTTHDPYAARDLITGQTYLWNASPFIRLDPRGNVAHILHITP